MSKRLLLTGISSFTGCHIAKELERAGWSVTATLSKKRKDYDGLKAARIEYSGVNEFLEQSHFGADSFNQALASGDYSVWINHGAQIEGYRKADFDYLKSVSVSVNNAAEVFQASRKGAVKGWIHSGSFFEPGEGRSLGDGAQKEAASPAMSIYGVSKQLSWQILNYYAQLERISTAKVVIPNPVGAYENDDRLVPFFVRNWLEGKTPQMRTAHYIRDNLPGSWLGRVYAAQADAFLEGGNSDELVPKVIRPSGFCETNKVFVSRVAASFQRQTGKEAPVEYQELDDGQWKERSNETPHPMLADAQAVEDFFSQWITELVAR